VVPAPWDNLYSTVGLREGKPIQQNQSRFLGCYVQTFYSAPYHSITLLSMGEGMESEANGSRNLERKRLKDGGVLRTAQERNEL